MPSLGIPDSVPCDGLEGAHIWARVHLQALKLASVQVSLPPECVPAAPSLADRVRVSLCSHGCSASLSGILAAQGTDLPVLESAAQVLGCH